MHNHSGFVLLLTAGLIINCSLAQSAPFSRKNDANANVFKHLLGLYKVNPLKGSPTFQSFSDNLLMGMGRDSKDKLVLNFESSESVNDNEQVKMNLNEIENIIHTKNKKTNYRFEKPAYDLDGVSTENFKADLAIDDRVLSKEEVQNVLLEKHNTKEHFGSLFEHIDSNDIDTDLPVAKLLPANETIIQYFQVSNQNEAEFSYLRDSKGRPAHHIGTQGEFHDRNPEEVPMNNLIEDTRDVIGF